MKVYPEAYSKELDRLLPVGDVPAVRRGCEYYTLRNKEGRLLAAGVCWKRWLHPARINFYIGVEELYQRRGYGTMVFERMRADHPDAKWQGSADLDNDIAEWWLRGLGFEFSCRRYWLDAMVIDLEEDEQSGLSLTPYREMGQEQRDRLISMAWTDYAQKHEKVDPMNEEVDAEAFRAAALSGLNQEATCCLIENGEILAYAICSQMDDWATDVRFVGSRLADREKFRRFLNGFVHRAFAVNGTLIMEADSFDDDALTLMRLFGELPEDSYDTYVLE